MQTGEKVTGKGKKGGGGGVGNGEEGEDDAGGVGEACVAVPGRSYAPTESGWEMAEIRALMRVRSGGMRWGHVGLMLALLFAAAPTVFSQEEYSPTIKVESNLVVLYVEVWDEKVYFGPDPSYLGCRSDIRFRIESQSPSQPFVPSDCLARYRVSNLTANDFQVFEDGVEQQIESATVQPVAQRSTRDNWGWHWEWSYTPNGKWGTAELPRFSPALANSYYRIAYIPRNQVHGNCPQIRILVKRHRSLVYASDHYCYVEHFETDPLEKTKLGAKLASALDSDRRAKIPLHYQIGFFYIGPEKARVDIVLEFPWDRLQRYWEDGWLRATIGVLGWLKAKDHGVTQFSDFACCSGESPAGYWYMRNMDSLAEPNFREDDRGMLPTRYEKQIDVGTGKYQLQVILGDGKDFGRFSDYVLIDDFDGKRLNISSVLLSNRFRNATVAALEAKAVNFAPRYTPLVSRGVEITPAGDTTFEKNGPLIAYFEIYEPSLTQQPKPIVTAHMRIIDARTGAVKVEFPEIDGFTYEEPGSTTMRVGSQLKIGDLPKGDYRLEVSATDSTGQRTPVRTANFRME